MKRLLPTIILLTSLATPALAGQAEIDFIVQASLTHNMQQLTEFTKNYTGYDQAFAQYQLAIAHSVRGEQDASLKQLNSAIKNLEKLVVEHSQDSEHWALLAQSYGLKAGYQPIKAAYYGPKANNALAKAKSLNTENPRVHLFTGISKYNTPELFGGSKDAALTALNKALELYEVEISTDKSWGYADAYIWRGLTYIALNEPEKAKFDWHQALIIEPNHGWAKMLIANN